MRRVVERRGLSVERAFGDFWRFPGGLPSLWVYLESPKGVAFLVKKGETARENSARGLLLRLSKRSAEEFWFIWSLM